MFARVTCLSFLLSMLSLAASPSISSHEELDVASRIIGGLQTDPGRLPWQVRLSLRLSSRVSGICGGSVIADRWVVTAAHCLKNLNASNQLIELSAQDVQVEMFRRGQARDISVDRIFIHPDWDGNFRNRNDIALLRVSGDLLENSAIQLISEAEFQSANRQFEQTWIANQDRPANAIASGYGIIQQNPVQQPNLNALHYVWLSIPPLTERRCLIRNSANRPIPNDQTLVCAASPEVNVARDTCRGDSGGPLVWQNPQRKSDSDFGFRLIGVTSFGPQNCNETNVQSGYASIRNYRNWVDETLQANGAQSLVNVTRSKFSDDPSQLRNTSSLGASPNRPGLPPFPDQDAASTGSSGGIFHAFFLGLISFSLIYRRLSRRVMRKILSRVCL